MAVIASAAPTGLAQSAEEPEARRLNTVTVTARKKEETLQDVPISINVTSGAEIQDQGYRDLQQIVANIPAVNVSRAGGGDNLSIRGIGSGENPGFEQAVGFVFDGVALGRSRATRAGTVDLERVEVLKGPQTTYFGANTIAGVVNVTSRGADLDAGFTGYGRTSYEFETDEYVFEGAANIPVNDQLAFRVAGKYSDASGFIDDTGLDTRIGGEEDVLFRVSSLWEPTDNFRAEAKYTYGQTEGDDGLNLQLVGQCQPFAPPLGQGGIATFNCIGADGAPIETDLDFERATDIDAPRELEYHVGTLNLNYDIGEYTLTSVTGYYEFENDFLIDLDTSTVPSLIAPTRFSLAQFDDAQQISQELRIASPVGRKFEWTAGLYFQDEEVDFSNALQTAFSPPIPAVAAPTTFAALSQQDAQTYSAFGTVLWNVTDRLRATVGLRYIGVDKTIDQSPQSLGVLSDGLLPNARDFQPFNPVAMMPVDFVQVTQSIFDDDVLPSLDIQYDLTETTNVYFSFGQGFKAGGFSLANPATPPGAFVGVAAAAQAAIDAGNPDSPANFIQAFDPETVDAYEIGLKGAWFDGRVVGNVALFWQNFDDRQVSSLAETTGAALTQAVANAAETRSRGVEFDVTAQVTDNLTLSGEFTYLDSEFQNFTNSPCFTGQSVAAGCVEIQPGVFAQDLSGATTPFAPEWSGSITALYERPIGGFVLSIEPNVFFTDGFALISDLTPVAFQDSFAKVNLRVALRPESDRWEVAFVGRNLNDELTTTFCQEAATNLNGALGACAVDRPATFAIQGRVNF